MSWNDVAEALNKMVDQPRESDLYLTPAAKARADKFLAEMRVLHFPFCRECKVTVARTLLSSGAISCAWSLRPLRPGPA